MDTHKPGTLHMLKANAAGRNHEEEGHEQLVGALNLAMRRAKLINSMAQAQVPASQYDARHGSGNASLTSGPW
jgi:hypothetical protein